MSKWPNMRPVADRHPDWVGSRQSARLRRIGREVKNRTGASMWVDLFRRHVAIGYERPDGDIGIAMSMPVEHRFDPALNQMGVDDICYALQLAKVDPEKKRRWVAQREKDLDDQRHIDNEAFMADRRHDVEREMRRSHERYAMGRHYKGRAVVSGIGVH